MVCPVNHLIATGAYIPALVEEDKNVREINILFKDYYSEIYKKYGISRDEMMILMPFVMCSDVLSGTDKYDYYGEYFTNKESKPDSKPIEKKGKGSIVDSVTVEHKNLDSKLFTKKQLTMIDLHGLGRTYITIKVKEINENYYEILMNLMKLQYKLDMKFLKPIIDVCRYISQKTPLIGNDKDISNASIVIEPLHGNIFNTIIPYTPVNQSLKVGTVVNLNAETEFTGPKSTRKFLWSNNLETHEKVPENPWLKCVHYGTIDIGSKFTGKFIVSEVDTEIQQSFSLFGFRRDDSKKYITLWIYNCYNVTPKELMTKIMDKNKDPALDKYIKEVIALL